MFEGIRIFDVSDPTNPTHIHSVPTPCGSHTHTLVPDPASNRVFLYISSYPLGGAALGPDCQDVAGGGGHHRISIVEVPLNNPQGATVSPYFLDPETELADYFGFQFTACHDISVFVELDLAAAACLTEGQVWDISNPAEPEFLYRYDNPNIKPENVDLFHSAAFSWDGSIIAFGDESGGGGAARCVDPDDNQGRVWFIDTESGEELASYKIPRSITTSPCTMHNFNFVPTKTGNNVLVSSAYTGGTTVVDVDALIGGASEAEAEIGYAMPEGVNAWSSYWYNGFIYSNGGGGGTPNRGLDVFKLTDPRVRRDIKLPYMNPQTQEEVLH
jgi:LVIVD repeat